MSLTRGSCEQVGIVDDVSVSVCDTCWTAKQVEEGPFDSENLEMGAQLKKLLGQKIGPREK